MFQDLRYALRSLRRAPAFAAMAATTLALGIGATTAIYTVANAVLFRPLPFDGADRIVAVTNLWAKRGLRSATVSAPDYHDWKAQSRSFEAMGYYLGGETSVTIRGAGDYAQVFRVTPGFFEALGMKAAAGHLLSAEELAPGGPLAAVISDSFWKRQFDGHPSALGSTIKFSDRIFTITGILPPRVQFPARADVYYSAAVLPETTSRGAHNYRVVARLREGVSLAQANSEMNAIAAALERQYPATNDGKMVSVVSLQGLLVDSTRQTLYVLLGAVGLVLLIACANVANLLLARSSHRAREMVIRAAVGASRGRLVKQLLTESLVLGVAGGLGGLWLARLGVIALVALAPANFPRVDEIRADNAALVFALIVAILASLVFGLAPAFQSSRVELVAGLREGGKGSSVGARAGWARSAFVVAQVAMAVVLVAAAGLLVRSLIALASVDMGFEAERLLVLRTAVPVRSFQEAPRATAFYREILTELRALPGIDAVAGVTSLPSLVRSNGGYWLEGGPGPLETGVRAPQALFTVVTPDYFRTLRVPLRRGRDFTDQDRRDAQFVAIVNEALVRESFPDGNPIGRRIQCGLDTLEFMTIVGVVADVRTSGPSLPPRPEIYMPYEQHPGPAAALNLVVRSGTGDPLGLADTLRRRITSRNADVPVRITTMEGTLETATATPRFRTFLLVVFASVALLLALAGVYGVMAYTVSQRIPELGVRIALGATPGNVLRLVLGHGAALAAAGLVLGLGLALASGKLLEGLLFGITPRDPALLSVVTLLVAVVILAAGYIPARRATKVDPLIALRGM